MQNVQCKNYVFQNICNAVLQNEKREHMNTTQRKHVNITSLRACGLYPPSPKNELRSSNSDARFLIGPPEQCSITTQRLMVRSVSKGILGGLSGAASLAVHTQELQHCRTNILDISHTLTPTNMKELRQIWESNRHVHQINNLPVSVHMRAASTLTATASFFFTNVP